MAGRFDSLSFAVVKTRETISPGLLGLAIAIMADCYVNIVGLGGPTGGSANSVISLWETRLAGKDAPYDDGSGIKSNSSRVP